MTPSKRGEISHRVPAYELKDISFPECASRCLAIEVLGCGECESVCPLKFTKQAELELRGEQ